MPMPMLLPVTTENQRKRFHWSLWNVQGARMSPSPLRPEYTWRNGFCICQIFQMDWNEKCEWIHTTRYEYISMGYTQKSGVRASLHGEECIGIMRHQRIRFSIWIEWRLFSLWHDCSLIFFFLPRKSGEGRRKNGNPLISIDLMHSEKFDFNVKAGLDEWIAVRAMKWMYHSHSPSEIRERVRRL